MIQSLFLVVAEVTKEISWLTGMVKELSVQQGGVKLKSDS